MAESDGVMFLSATLEDLPPNSVFEPGRSEAAGAGEVTAVAVDDHRQRGDPGAERNGCCAVSNAAGQTHSSRSRICWT